MQAFYYVILWKNFSWRGFTTNSVKAPFMVSLSNPILRQAQDERM
jgi:hypothetical protein